MQTLILVEYTPTERKLLKLLWKDGEVKPKQHLRARKDVLSTAGVLKDKSGVLSNLYAKLLDESLIEFDKRYVAKAYYA